MNKIIKILILLLLIPIASASIVINNNLSVTETVFVPINITGEETYTLTVDNNTSIFNSSDVVMIINSTKGYHNVTVNNSTTLLIYDTSPPEIIISNFSPASYHYTHLPIPIVNVSDDNFPIFMTQSAIISSPGNHTFSVTVTDIANHQTTLTVNYTVISNTTINVTKDSMLLLPLMNSTLSFNSNNPVNLSITLPSGFTASQSSYTNITSLNFTIKSGITSLDIFVHISVYYADSYGMYGEILFQYWMVGNKTIFYISYDSNEDTYISRQEAMNATKVYYSVTSISPDRIKEMIRLYRNNQTYIG